MHGVIPYHCNLLRRSVCLCLTGHYPLRDDRGSDIPVLHSTVGYIGMTEGGEERGTQLLQAWSTGVIRGHRPHPNLVPRVFPSPLSTTLISARPTPALTRSCDHRY